MTDLAVYEGIVPKEAGPADPRVDVALMSSSTFSSPAAQTTGPTANTNTATEARPQMGVRGVTSEAMSSSTDGLVLYDLTSKPGARQTFSPHCIKTVLALRLLDVGYDRQRRTFHQIRTELAQRVSDRVTVPTLELSNGSHLTDSWAIALYLAQKHPQGSLLFPNGAASKALASLLNTWGPKIFGPRIQALSRPRIYDLLDPASARYFEEEKCGKAKLDKMRAMRPEERQAHVEACKAALELVESALAESKRGAPPFSRWLEGGELPSHADFVVYGFYGYSKTAGPAVVKEIWNAHPNVAQWVQDMTEWADKDITADFL